MSDEESPFTFDSPAVPWLLVGAMVAAGFIAACFIALRRVLGWLRITTAKACRRLRGSMSVAHPALLNRQFARHHRFAPFQERNRGDGSPIQRSARQSAMI